MVEEFFFKKAKIIEEEERELVEIRRRKKETDLIKSNPFDDICESFGCEKVKTEVIMIANVRDRERALNKFGRKK